MPQSPSTASLGNPPRAWAQRWRALPRDVRDTLFLLLVIAWVVAPHVQHIPLWCSALAVAVLLGRAYLALQGRPLPGLRLRLPLLLAALLGTWLSYKTLLGREAGITLVVVLLCMKTLELRARRDAFVIFFLGFFVLLTHFLYSQALWLAAVMLLGLWGLLAAVVNAHMPAGRPPLAQAFKTAGWLMLFGAPIMVVLFALFPRFAPLWGVAGDSAAAKSGLSERMKVGSVAEVALDDGIVMRIKFADEAPPKSEMYFRGPVLSSFDGQEWTPDEFARITPTSPGLSPAVQGRGPNYQYQVTLEPLYRPWVFALDVATQLPQLDGRAVWQNADLQLITRRPVSDLQRYSASSQTQYRYALDLPRWQQQQNSGLPAQSNPRTQAWAKDWARQAQQANPSLDAAALAEKFSSYLLQYLYTENYRYTLEPGEFGVNSADEFWFDKREGFCEHIASSYVIAMRAIGVPARIVTGYQGAELNSIDDFWVVRNSDAHAWAEIWVQGKGWLRIDPTGAIAPWRVDRVQRRLSAEPTAVGAAFGRVVSPNLLAQMRRVWEASNNTWNQWVLNYTQTRQLDALKKLGFESPSWQSLVQLLGVLFAVGALVGAVYSYWQRQHIDPWLRLLRQARARLAKQQIATNDAMSPRQIAALTQQADWQAWLLELERLRYSQGDKNTSLAQLRQRLRRLRRL